MRSCYFIVQPRVCTRIRDYKAIGIFSHTVYDMIDYNDGLVNEMFNLTTRTVAEEYHLQNNIF